MRRGGGLWAAGAGLALSLLQCQGGARPPAAAAGAWEYEVTPPGPGSWRVAVEATIERAPGERLVAGEAPAAFHEVSVLSTGGQVAPAARDGDAWVVPACRKRCRLRYDVDLDALASACHRLDCGRRVGDAVVSQASAWMLRPEGAGDAAVRVRLPAGPSERFATGLRRDPGGDGFVLRAEDLGEASYTAFGSFRRATIDAPGARLDLVLLGAPIAMGDAGVAAWVRGAAGCVSDLFGRFPVDATIFIVPVAGADEVVFGRVMSLTGASVVLLFGAEARPENAPHDWVAVHELFHLACPSFVGEGHWLEEGLATYYEPILRARAGWMTEAELWGDFVEQMPRGLRTAGEPASLEERDDMNSTYWGGALFALLADVRIRTLSLQGGGSPRSLDDVLRAVLARQGDATHRARVADFLRTGAEAVGLGALEEVYEQDAVRGENVDLADLWSRLGVERGEGGQGGPAVHLRDDAPLAAVRKAIAGTGH